MQISSVLVVLCLLTVACSGTSATPTAASDEGPATTASPEATPTAAVAASPGTGAVPELMDYPYANELLPNDVAVVVDQAGVPTLAVAGHRQVQILRPAAEPILRVPAEAYGEFAQVSALVAFEGDFIVAIGATETSPLLPELLRWSESTATWLPIATSVTQPASYRAAARLATPPSPPFGGDAAILDMTVHNNVIWATGWATTSNRDVRAALWKSVDTATWTLEFVPAVGSSHGPEYGQALSVTDLGVMISLGNATHYGAGTMGRVHGSGWEALPFPTTNDASSIATVVDSSGDTAWVQEQFFGAPDVIHMSNDLHEWSAIDLPELEARINDEGYPDGGFWSLDPDGKGGPVAWYSTQPWGESMSSQAWQWRVDEERFVTTTVPGNYVGSGADFVVTQQVGNFVVLPRSEVFE